MSAYVMSRDEIRFLVAVAQRLELHWYHRCNHYRIHSTDVGAGERLGQLLWDENVASVRARYPECDELPGPVDGDYQYGKHSLAWAIKISFDDDEEKLAAIRLLWSYKYQSCEHEGWKDSEAKEFCDFLEVAIVRSLSKFDLLDADLSVVRGDA